MSQNITKIKSRIRTVNSAYKVTSAMKLVSSVKLRTWKSKMIANKRFADEILATANDVLCYLQDIENPFINGYSNATKNLYVVVSSSLGLCGAYNTNIFKLSHANIKKEDDAIILGKKGIIHFANDQFNKLTDFENFDSIKSAVMVKSLARHLVKLYSTGQYKEVHIIYTEYRNPIVFTSKDLRLLPLASVDSKESCVGYPPLLEPSKEELLEKLVPFIINNVTYSCILEAEVCEQAARNNAMENATDNAEELLNDLQIEFNKARQDAITQEIVEIAAAANAI